MRSKINVALAATLVLAAFGCAARDTARTEAVKPSPGGAKSDYDRCIALSRGEQPEMLACIQTEIGRLEQVVRASLSKNYENPTKKIIDSIKRNRTGWEHYVASKCDLYLELEGQRAELMQQSCVLSETKIQASYVDELIFSSEN